VDAQAYAEHFTKTDTLKSPISINWWKKVSPFHKLLRIRFVHQPGRVFLPGGMLQNWDLDDRELTQRLFNRLMSWLEDNVEHAIGPN